MVVESTPDQVIEVQVAYALPERQWLWPLRVPCGCTVGEAIARSPLRELVPDADVSDQSVGVFGQPCALGTRLAAGDRVEVYRPLLCDPKQGRRDRAARR